MIPYPDGETEGRSCAQNRRKCAQRRKHSGAFIRAFVAFKPLLHNDPAGQAVPAAQPAMRVDPGLITRRSRGSNPVSATTYLQVRWHFATDLAA